jgi:hypothetical protein
MDSETKDTTDAMDYVATLTPELLNLSSKCEYDFKPEMEVKCKLKSFSFMNYFFIFILFFVLFQLVLKLKIIHYKVCTILNVLTTLSFKVDQVFKSIRTMNEKMEGPKQDQPVSSCPIEQNLNYILDFIHQIDKKHKCD